MKISRVTLTVEDPQAAGAFYRDVLGLPVAAGDNRVTVAAGRSQLVLDRGTTFSGAHHVAFGVVPADFDITRRWLRERADPFVVDGTDVIPGPDGWNSRSLYFLGPEGIVLEYIARDVHAHLPGTGVGGRMTCVNEVGVGVPDVPFAVETLSAVLGLPAYPPQEDRFAPFGDEDGLLILVAADRVWFPTDATLPALGPVTIELDELTGEAHLGTMDVFGVSGSAPATTGP